MKYKYFIFVTLLVCNVASDENLNFLILGDWGGRPDYPYYTDIEEHVAKQMATVSKAVNASFALALGKNFEISSVMTCI